MKLTIVLLAVAFNVSAGGYSQTVTLNKKNALLIEIFKEIRQQTGYDFLYQLAWLEKAKPVDIAVKNASLIETLDKCFKDQPLTYSVVGTTIVLQPKNQNADSYFASEKFIDVKGKVLNEQGNPVEGVTITIKGTRISTSTNANGDFALTSVEHDAILVFNHVSMEAFELKVSGKRELIVKLKTKVSELGGVEVVNTGYQKISKERFVGSFQQLDSQAFHSRPGMGIIERLDGRVNSVFFQKKGTSTLPSIMIRGLSTIGRGAGIPIPTSPDPLIVVDNFPMPLFFKIENINPNDVESITVLTDAAAASIWGSRAGNGVIVITTKKGKYNQRFNLNVSANITIEQKPNLYFYDQVTPSEYIDMELYLFSKGGYDGLLSDRVRYPVVSPVVEILDRQRRGLLTKNLAQGQIDVWRNSDLRQQLDKYVYRNAVKQQYYLSVNGGTNILAYQISGGYNRILNNIQGSKSDEQYTINTNTSFKPLKNLEITTGISLALGKTQSTNIPIIPPYPYGRLADDEGNALAIPYIVRQGYIDTIGGGKLLDWHYRPLDEIKYANNVTTARFIRLNVALNYQFNSWLKAGIQYQLQNNLSQNRTFYSLQSYMARNLINQFTNFAQPTSSPNLRYPIPVGGVLDANSGMAKDQNIRASLSFNKSFGADHQINALVASDIYDSKGGFGLSSRTFGYDPVTGVARGNMDYFTSYITPYAPYNGSKLFIDNFGGGLDGDINRVVSLSANGGYTYKSRYTVFASARRDGANLYGVSTNNKWKPLWSAGAGWEVSKEGFYQLAALPYLKIRASYGYTGNSNNNLSGVLTFTNNPTLDPITGLPSNRPDFAANSNLKWEEVGMTNIAVDFSLFKSQRLRGSFEVYRKKATDQISLSPNPMSTGVTSFVANYGNLKTDGYEISLQSRNIEGVISWNTSLGWSHAKTTITRLFRQVSSGFRVSDYTDYNLNAQEGQIIFGMASYRWAGLDPLSGDPQGYYQGQVSKDYNSFANDSVKNQIFHGSSLPMSTAFLRNTISWKELSLSFNLTGRFQYYFREPVVGIGNLPTLSPDYFHRWQKPGDEAFTTIPSMYYPLPGALSGRQAFYSLAEIHVKRGDNIRMQDVNISYQWMNRGNKVMPFQSVNLFAYLNNINWIIWRLEDSKWDSDFIYGGNAGQIPPPPSRTWTIGAALNF